MKPVDAVLAVTYRCNAKCAMCGIWKADPGREIAPETYRKLPATLRDVNLTGGEPFLREDLPAIHEAVRTASPGARTVISTNGLLTDRIVSQMREIVQTEPHAGMAVSLDGPRDVHDRLRGVRGAYEKALNTVNALQDAGIANLRLAFTATRENVHCLNQVYDLARELGVQFTCAVQHGSSHYFHLPPPEERLPADELGRQLARVIRRELRSLSPKRWARAYFMAGLYRFETKGDRPLSCSAGRDFFFMDPSGDIYTCNVAEFRMGNLARQDFDELWNSPQAGDARMKAAQCPAGCWMICTARTAIKRHGLRVIAWALRRRLTGVDLKENESCGSP